MPDDVVFVNELPHTAVGKLDKLRLREQFSDHPLPSALEAENGPLSVRRAMEDAESKPSAG
jgi:fatty-acyl-CoA synthase